MIIRDGRGLRGFGATKKGATTSRSGLTLRPEPNIVVPVEIPPSCGPDQDSDTEIWSPIHGQCIPRAPCATGQVRWKQNGMFTCLPTNTGYCPMGYFRDPNGDCSDAMGTVRYHAADFLGDRAAADAAQAARDRVVAADIVAQNAEMQRRAKAAADAQAAAAAEADRRAREAAQQKQAASQEPPAKVVIGPEDPRHPEHADWLAQQAAPSRGKYIAIGAAALLAALGVGFAVTRKPKALAGYRRR